MHVPASGYADVGRIQHDGIPQSGGECRFLFDAWDLKILAPRFGSVTTSGTYQKWPLLRVKRLVPVAERSARLPIWACLCYRPFDGIKAKYPFVTTAFGHARSILVNSRSDFEFKSSILSLYQRYARSAAQLTGLSSDKYGPCHEVLITNARVMTIVLTGINVNLSALMFVSDLEGLVAATH